MVTGSLTLHKRLPSLRIQAQSLGYSAVLGNRAGSQSTDKLRPSGLSSGWVKAEAETHHFPTGCDSLHPSYGYA
jgi:hypothetical protein